MFRMGPIINLVVGVLALSLLYLLFRARHGWIWRWFGPRADTERVQIEDALKHLYHCGEEGVPGTLESVAGALQITSDRAAQLAEQLNRRKLATARGTGFDLTEDGRSYALQVIRTHRLWEQYLAHETGVAESDWHARADRVEHHLTPAEVDALSARLGNPAFDPHGDPIPTSSGQMRAPEGQPLTTLRAGRLARVVHIEDEPASTYRELRAAHLEPGMTVRVLAQSADAVQIDTGVAQCQLSPLIAVHVTVQPLAEEAGGQLCTRRLSSLAAGQHAVVASIAPACRGVERRRLLDLGLVPGTRVKAEFSSPAGDPVAYRVRGALIALRRQQADMICVES
jgi:DtxR family transcriptional regulator, Mn-dependent transcriptional regulator